MSNSGNNNSGNFNSGNNNSGNYNSGDCNSGHNNSGYCNSGHNNSGYYNSGNNNSGNYNSGSYNSGDCNSGHNNSGYYNSGNNNSGNYNSGSYNSGHNNSGYYNSGNNNSGNYNSGSYNSGYCNTNSPTVRLFNKDSGWEFHDNNHSKFRRIIYKYQKLLCEWVYESNMTEQEKSDNPSYKTTGGYLKVNSSTYNGKEVTKEDKEFLESVPNFCPKILKETTGIVFETTKKIVIDGKTIEISLDSYEKLRDSLIGEK